MILTAFSGALQSRWSPDSPLRAWEVLHGWLLEHLTDTAPQSQVTRVLQYEIQHLDAAGHVAFIGRSVTGQRLLHSLYQYCDSYEQWQFRRWLHDRTATNFQQG